MPKKGRCDLCARRKPLRHLMLLDDRGDVIRGCRDAGGCDVGRCRADARFFRRLIGGTPDIAMRQHLRDITNRNARKALGFR